LTDNLNARFSGRFERGDAWQYSTTRPGDELGDLENAMFRLMLDYAPLQALHLTFNVNGWVDKSQPQAGQYKFITPQFPDNISPLQTATPFAPNDARAADWSPGSPRAADNRFYQAPSRRRQRWRRMCRWSQSPRTTIIGRTRERTRTGSSRRHWTIRR
jgi:hypothetical protein